MISGFYPLSFKVLNKSETGLLSLEEFLNVYEASELKWRESKDDPGPWFNHVVNSFLRHCGEAVNKFVKWKIFKYLVFVVLISNAIFKASSDAIPIRKGKERKDDILRDVELGFLGFYIFEAAVKVFGLGPKKYFRYAGN